MTIDEDDRDEAVRWLAVPFLMATAIVFLVSATIARVRPMWVTGKAPHDDAPRLAAHPSPRYPTHR